MFKVSFKENPNFPVKKVQKFNDDKITIVTLYGEVQLPVYMQHYIPPEIWDWMECGKNVEATISTAKIHLTIKGKARKADDDVDNPVLGERIAECRAKINLYRFMYHLISKLYIYYCQLLSVNTLTEGGYKDDTIQGAMTKYANFYSREEAHLKALLTHEPDTDNRTDKEILADLKKKLNEPDTESPSQS